MLLDYNSIGKRIRRHRKELKLTQAELAEHADLSTAYVGLIERGVRIMSVETLFKLAKALNCSTDELLGMELQKIDTENSAIELLELAQALASKKLNNPPNNLKPL